MLPGAKLKSNLRKEFDINAQLIISQNESDDVTNRQKTSFVIKAMNYAVTQNNYLAGKI